MVFLALPYEAVLHVFFFFLLFSAIGYTIIYTIILQQHMRKLEERVSGPNENRVTFLFSFHFNCLKAFMVINWKL